jgi:hypothetical protein
MNFSNSRPRLSLALVAAALLAMGGHSAGAEEVGPTAVGPSPDSPLADTSVEEVGALDVEKVVAGDPGEGEEFFTIEVDCDNDDFDETLGFDTDGRLRMGTTPIVGIPLGTECTVTETDVGLEPWAPPATGPEPELGDIQLLVHYQVLPDGVPSVHPPTVTIDTEGETVAVRVENFFIGPVGEEDPVGDGDNDGDGDGDDGNRSHDGTDDPSDLPNAGA